MNSIKYTRIIDQELDLINGDVLPIESSSDIMGYITPIVITNGKAKTKFILVETKLVPEIGDKMDDFTITEIKDLRGSLILSGEKNWRE